MKALKNESGHVSEGDSRPQPCIAKTALLLNILCNVSAPDPRKRSFFFFAKLRAILGECFTESETYYTAKQYLRSIFQTDKIIWSGTLDIETLVTIGLDVRGSPSTEWYFNMIWRWRTSAIAILNDQQSLGCAQSMLESVPKSLEGHNKLSENVRNKISRVDSNTWDWINNCSYCF